MNLFNVYIGITKGGKEHLFHKQHFIIGDESVDLYIDMNNGKKYFESEVTIVSRYSNNLKGIFRSRKKVISHYDLDRRSRLELANIVVADLVKYSKKQKVRYKNKLFEIIQVNDRVKARDLIDNKIYFVCKCNESHIENYRDARIILKYDDDVNIVIKKKVLERNYKIHGGK